MTRPGVRPRWRWFAAAVAIATMTTACGGLPSSLPIPRPTASDSPGQSAGQQLKLAAMQRLFNLLNTTQRDGQTVLTTRITQSGPSGGRYGPQDYALGKVSPAQATLEFGWQFTDPPTNTNASGTIRLEHLTVVEDNNAAIVEFGYSPAPEMEERGRNRTEDAKNSPAHTVQTYVRSDADGGVRPVSPEDTGPIHLPVVPLTHAIRSAMTVPQDLAFTEASGRNLRVGPVRAIDVRCKLSRSMQLRTNENVEIYGAGGSPVQWSADDSPTGAAYRGPGTYVNQHISITNGTVPGTVVVNPDERSGTMTGSQPGPISGVDAISGRFLCPPRSVQMTLESYS